MKVLILGVSGMLGSAMYKFFHDRGTFETWGTLRDERALSHFSPRMREKLIMGVDILNQDDLIQVFEKIRPDYVINCIGVIKQLSKANDPLAVLPINSLFPHRLAKICALLNTKLIHISTDCVFSGTKEDKYTEADFSDAKDLYGKSKFIGEINHLPDVITLRTSIIGHELSSNYSLVDWFLSQKNKVQGYMNAIYSGLPTIELARVIHDFVIPNPELGGLYHVASEAINKFELLKLIAEVYNKTITIEPEWTIKINRSLCAKRFELQTGYIAPAWPTLIEQMYQSAKLVGAVHV